MSDVIKKYYEQAQVMPLLVEQKLKRFDANVDIRDEFEAWIQTKEYKENDAVCIEGYTAKSLSELSPLTKGESAFILLIELRENPQKALNRINKGLKKK